MMTEDIFTAINQDKSDKLRDLMGVGKVGFKKEIWEGSKIWPRVSRRMSALQLAVRTGSKEVIKMLVDEAGLNVNYGQASTALTAAIEYQHSDMLTILIDRGAQVNKAILYGYGGMGEGWVLHSFPIHMAVQAKDVTYLQILLKAGADPLKEYSDFSSTNKYKTSISLLEAVRKGQFLHAMLILQWITTIDSKKSDSQTILGLVEDAYNLLLTQTNSLILQEVIAELIGKGIVQSVSQEDPDSTGNKQYKPLKLKQICRKTIRVSYKSYISKDYGKTLSIMQTVRLLPLPSLLIKYILLTDEMEYYTKDEQL